MITQTPSVLAAALRIPANLDDSFVMDRNILDGAGLAAATATIVATIVPLGPTVEQLAEIANDVRDMLLGSAREIDHQIGDRQVTIEMEDDDVLVHVEGGLIAHLDASGVAIAH